MSLSSHFLVKHKALTDALSQSYGEKSYFIAKSESELSLGSFPAIGLFLGIPEHSKESRTYAPIRFNYILCCFDVYDIDNPDDLLTKQQTMFELIEGVISTMSFTVLTDIEPIVSIGTGEGSFITGWTTTIEFKAN